jgi:hypothetical protein
VTVTDQPATVEPPRDRWGRYLIPDPDTGEVRAYTRATTFAKLTADTYHLNQWKVRKVVEGLAARPDLVLAASALTADDKKALENIAEAAKEHAGGSTGATIGTALHSLTEKVDRGETPHVVPPYDADVAAYVEAVAAAGLDILPEWIEKVVVLPGLDVAGTLDRVVADRSGRLLIADLKTGRSLPFGEIAIQLALYANASHTFDPATGELTPMPDVDRDTALVFHLPARSGRCEVLEVNIAEGAAMFPTLAAVQRWRKRKDLAGPYVPPAGTSPAEVAAAVADVEGAALDELAAWATRDVLPDDSTAARLAWIEDTLARLDTWGRLADLAERWPDNTRTPRQAREAGVPLTDDELDAIFRAVVDLAGRLTLDFDLFPTPYPGDGDAPLPRNAPIIADLRLGVATLPADLKQQVADELTAAGVPPLSSGKARTGHLAIVTRSVDKANAEYARRLALGRAHLEHLPPNARDAARNLAGPAGPDGWTAAALEVVGCLGDALDVGLLVVDADGEFEVGPNAEALILEHFGAKRPFVAAAKRAAELCGHPKPGSAVQAMDDPAVVALAYFTTPTTGQEQPS